MAETAWLMLQMCWLGVFQIEFLVIGVEFAAGCIGFREARGDRVAGCCRRWSPATAGGGGLVWT